MTVLEGHTCEPARLQHPGLRAGTTAMTLVWLHVLGRSLAGSMTWTAVLAGLAWLCV